MFTCHEHIMRIFYEIGVEVRVLPTQGKPGEARIYVPEVPAEPKKITVQPARLVVEAPKPEPVPEPIPAPTPTPIPEPIVVQQPVIVEAPVQPVPIQVVQVFSPSRHHRRVSIGCGMKTIWILTAMNSSIWTLGTGMPTRLRKT